jgi:hypothetical protein
MKTGLYQHYKASQAFLNVYGDAPAKDHVWVHNGTLKSMVVRSRGEARKYPVELPLESWVFIASRDLLNWEKVKDGRP